MSERDLPVELLENIFSFVCIPCHRRPLECMRAGCKGATHALVLGKVCRVWRDVAWALPDLWQRVDIIVTKEDHEDGFATKVQLVREWIQRAKGRPLTISIQPTEESYSRRPPLPIFNLMASYSMQWKDLYLHTTDDCIQILNKIPRGRTPCLETLKIERDHNSQRYETGALDFIADAPNLKILDYEEYWLPDEHIRNPWPKLVSLTSHGGVGNIGELRHSCPNLQHLKLHKDSSSGLFPPSRGHFSHLKSLVIRKEGGLLDAFNAPLLENLAILDPWRYFFSIEILNTFLDASGCNLRGFGIALDHGYDVESLQNLLFRMQNITHLYIGSYKASDYQPMMRRIPRMLDPKASGDDPRGVLLPKLEVLYYYTIDPVRTADMVNMIKHRWNGVEGSKNRDVAKLRRVRFTKWKEEILADQLKEEIEQGLEVAYDLSYEDDPF